MIDLKQLNDEQRKAVEFVGTQQMILAGAGSGKTKAVTYKVAYLIKKGFKPDSILVLTFTNKAAKEMKERIKELVGKRADAIWIGTFHSIFAKILRNEAKYINYKNNFSVYDLEDSLSLVNNVMDALGVDIEGLTPNGVRHRISYLKNHMITPDEYRKKIAK